jgi:threonyl-tRNA synthetase
MQVYRDFGFNEVTVKLALRPEKRLGTDAFWDKTEEMLRRALRAANVEWTELPGEGAFYAPKIEYHLKDSIGRSWQLGTMQLDTMMPERLGAEYVDETSGRKHPVMLHRAIVGSMERFIGILIEHHAGAMPLWLAPVQAAVTPIVSDADAYAKEVAALLGDAGFRVETDLRNEKINYKIREHALQKIPVLCVVGRREAEEKTVTLRFRGEERQETIPLADVVARLRS